MAECPWCHEEIPAEAAEAHEAGSDGQRVECPHQDLEAIRAAEQPPEPVLRLSDAW